jgi:hypothetical protein
MPEVSTANSEGKVRVVDQLPSPPSPPVLSSMEIVKRREIPGRQVHALAYKDTAGRPWFWIIRLIQRDNGSWLVCGGGGGSGDPHWDRPCINLAGTWGTYGLALGGRVTHAGVDQAASARLRMGDTVLSDDIGGGIVLFVTSEPTVGSSATVELLAQDGSALWRDELDLDD